MNFDQLLDSLRADYLKKFRGVLRERRHAPATTIVAEPVLCKEDGEAARSGALSLPVRVDMVIRAELKEEETVEIMTETVRDFEPLDIAWNDAVEVSLHPFRWEACQVLLHGVPALDQWWPIIEWFEKWFDEFDSKASLKRDVQEVVHSLSDPVVKDGAAAFKVDFGTAPASAIAEFFDACQNIGVQAIEIGN